MSSYKIFFRLFLVWLLTVVTAGALLAKERPGNKPEHVNRAYTISGVTIASKESYMFTCSPGLTMGDSWSVTGGGTLIASTYNTAYVYWGATTAGQVQIKSASGTVLASLSVGYSNGLFSTTLSPPWQVVDINGTPGVITAASSPATSTFQWAASTDGVNFYAISGATGATYQPPVALVTTFYRRYDTGGPPFNLLRWTTSVVVFSKETLQVGDITPANQAVNLNTAPAALTLAWAYGGTGGYTYNWQSSTDGINFTDVGFAGVQYSPPPITGNTWYRVRVQDSYGNNGYSATALAEPAFNPGTIVPAAITIAWNGYPSVLTATGQSGGSCAAYSYQWQQCTDGVNFTNIPNATSSTYQPGSLTLNHLFRCLVTCGNQSAYTTTSYITVLPRPDAGLNYIRVRELNRPVTDASSVDLYTSTAAFKQTTQYFDGLGRLMQTVARQASPGLRDVVAPTVYDVMGRESVQYLPYVAETAMDGGYKANALANQNTFNQAMYPGEQYYYGKTDYETSPSGRVLKAYAPGQSWVGNNMGASFKYWFNTTTDDVKIIKVDDVLNSWGTYSVTGVYVPGKLYKTVSVDERGKQLIEFKDDEGKLILTKVQLKAAADNGLGSGYTDWLCTYYVYDDRNNLRLVIQPRGVELLQPSWDLSNSTILHEQCFRYEYDIRGRMTRRKVPGNGEIWMVYDQLNRLVLMQDARMRLDNYQWRVYLYDKIGREIINGTTNYNADVINMQSLVSAQTTTPVTGGSEETPMEGVIVYKNPLPSGAALIVSQVTGYDTYNTIPAASGLTGDLDNTYTGSNYLSNTYNTSPDYAQPVTKSLQIRGMVAWTKSLVVGSSPAAYLYAVTVYDEYARPIQKKSKNSTTGDDIVTIQYSFDGRPLVTVTKSQLVSAANPQTHVVVTKIGYDVAGRGLSIKKSVSSNIKGVVVTKPETEIVNMDYDVLGKLKTKNIGKKKSSSGSYTNDALESLVYDYNIRGWLLGVNRDYLPDNATGKYFGYELGFDKLTNKSNHDFKAAQLNGNINGMVWKSSGDGIQRKYDYEYDAVNRLLKAGFEQHNDDDHLWNNQKVNYTVIMGDGVDATKAYDANGNILRMQKWGWNLTGSEQLDDLQYTYYNNGASNRLLNIIDLFNKPDTKLGDFRTSVNHPQKTDKDNYVINPAGGNANNITDYTYDDNGSIKKDLNKDLGTATGEDITYNYLNLPQVITLRKPGGAIKGTITYNYDASGSKLKKVVEDNSVSGRTVTITTKYIGGGIYESRTTVNPGANDVADYTDNLLYMADDEGRIRFTPAMGTAAARFDFDYYIKDHLGNVRMVLTDEQKQNIYPAVTLEGTGVPTDPVIIEKGFYNITDGYIVASPAAFKGFQNNNGNPPVNNNPNCNDNSVIRQYHLTEKSYKLNANTNRTGLGITIKVMAGDKVTIFGSSYYSDPNTGGSASNLLIPVTELVSGLLGTPAGVTAGKATSGDLNGNTVLGGLLGSFLTNPAREDVNAPSKPKAAINWILLDDHFNYVNGNFSAVGKVHNNDNALKDIAVTKNGYLYAYVSNESPVNVYFDNLQVIHDKGPLLEETHYYPFGLTMEGISSRTLGGMAGRNKFNGGSELNNDLDLNWYEVVCRNYDPQTGRFLQSDGFAAIDKGSSAYTFVRNNPVIFNDPSGLVSSYYNPQVLEEVTVVGKRKKKDDGFFDVIVDYFVDMFQGKQDEALARIEDNSFVKNVLFQQASHTPLAPSGAMAEVTPALELYEKEKEIVETECELMSWGIPGIAEEEVAVRAIEKGVEAVAPKIASKVGKVALDNNTLVDALERGLKDRVIQAIGSSKPIISITAAKECLMGGPERKAMLKAFMKEIGAIISKNGASAEQVATLQARAQSMGGRVLKLKDAKILQGAMNNNATLITRDGKVIKFMKAIFYPFITYPFP